MGKRIPDFILNIVLCGDYGTKPKQNSACFMVLGITFLFLSKCTVVMQ
jgi:hypothetical protein